MSRVVTALLALPSFGKLGGDNDLATVREFGKGDLSTQKKIGGVSGTTSTLPSP